MLIAINNVWMSREVVKNGVSFSDSDARKKNMFMVLDYAYR